MKHLHELTSTKFLSFSGEQGWDLDPDSSLHLRYDGTADNIVGSGGGGGGGGGMLVGCRACRANGLWFSLLFL